ncbi:hypothetical protein E2C01_042857 [Portunus trituberculatus]|uniref:Uncharacterized protein n=1 Tax=Portunus trituberculatus TaxID=210409 RepID=A0A5B7FUI5_PORTR|nr:hypothetical protein [Portunus trituberculatus]
MPGSQPPMPSCGFIRSIGKEMPGAPGIFGSVTGMGLAIAIGLPCPVSAPLPRKWRSASAIQLPCLAARLFSGMLSEATRKNKEHSTIFRIFHQETKYRKPTEAGAAAGDGREWTGCGASLSRFLNPPTPWPLLTSETKPTLLFATSTSCFSFDLHTNIIMIKGHNIILYT